MLACALVLVLLFSLVRCATLTGLGPSSAGDFVSLFPGQDKLDEQFQSVQATFAVSLRRVDGGPMLEPNTTDYAVRLYDTTFSDVGLTHNGSLLALKTLCARYRCSTFRESLKVFSDIFYAENLKRDENVRLTYPIMDFFDAPINLLLCIANVTVDEQQQTQQAYTLSIRFVVETERNLSSLAKAEATELFAEYGKAFGVHFSKRNSRKEANFAYETAANIRGSKRSTAAKFAVVTVFVRKPPNFNNASESKSFHEFLTELVTIPGHSVGAKSTEIWLRSFEDWLESTSGGVPKGGNFFDSLNDWLKLKYTEPWARDLWFDRSTVAVAKMKAFQFRVYVQAGGHADGLHEALTIMRGIGQRYPQLDSNL